MSSKTSGENNLSAGCSGRSFSSPKRWGLWVFLFLFSLPVYANPVLTNIAAGQASVQQTPSTTTVQQTSGKAVLNWQSFNVGVAEKVHFVQPAGGIALNRIDPSQGASAIYGQINATGQIILINQAGIYFGPNSYVNVGGIMVSTANIGDNDFMAGKLLFNQSSPYYGSIVNDGTIKSADYGYVALMAPSVVNNGTIQANLGQVVLASGQAFTISFGESSLIDFAI